MAKAPADQFYFTDYIRDTRSLKLNAKGAWMDFLSTAFFKTPQGRISQSLDDWATMFSCDVDEAKTVLEAIKKHDVGTVVTERNGDVTVTNRRKYNEWLEREANKTRQKNKRARDKGGGNSEPSQESNGNVTPLSSSSSSTSKKETTKNVVSRQGERIPEDFAVTSEQIAWAKEECPGVSYTTETAKFVNYYTAKTGNGATKLDWSATWRNWMLNARDRYGSNKTNNGKRTDADVLRESAEFYDKYPDS